jgi:cell wall assembly regulator SMI1
MTEFDQLRAALKRIDTWFAQHRPRYFKGLNPGATAAELEGLPEELRVLLAWHNGQSGDFVGCFEEHWFLMSVAEIREAVAAIPGRYPFLDDDAGNFLCVNTAKTPAPIWAYYIDDTTAGMVAPSLTAWMGAFADDLEAGRYGEDPERGTLIRKSIAKSAK